LSGQDRNPFFARGADGRYHDVAPLLRHHEAMVGRGIAIADVDGDGRLDYVAANQWSPSFFFKNEAPGPGVFLGLRLKRPNGAPAIGAMARVTLPDGYQLVAQVDGGTGHSGHSSPDIHFGLGAWKRDQAIEVEFQWRDGDGKIHRESLPVPSGWHTVQLGKDKAAVLATTRQP
jgi:enediyne biosynthesis protein E4